MPDKGNFTAIIVYPKENDDPDVQKKQPSDL
jgi:hypothetical protein